ncbi:hypothetical protein FB451DRAFT_1485342 [Mycena latifolia]|nr:hypothetical protein FB451DRAFT_1485342 [Mycena latifolia]
MYLSPKVYFLERFDTRRTPGNRRSIFGPCRVIIPTYLPTGSNDPETAPDLPSSTSAPTSSINVPTSSNQTLTGSNNSPASSTSQAVSSSPAPSGPDTSAQTAVEKKPIGAIVGGLIGGLLLAGLLLVFFLRCRVRRHNPDRVASSPETQQIPPPTREVMFSVSVGDSQLGTPVPETPGLSLEEQVRRLQAETELMRMDHTRLRTSVGSGSGIDTSSVTRSLSTMKSAQTRAVSQSYRQSPVRDSFLHTESGLHLTAGRFEDDVPPTYE